ncbi:unnamed protein product [Rhizoctonia solani]|uniref:F-box domain-containing protein n=1 Tax=Rhizoctonia solani TaxID=456999 RepID=A0A8H3I0H8_9AGAM|nr:unnamed protein product [Rhizoctonia solani]
MKRRLYLAWVRTLCPTIPHLCDKWMLIPSMADRTIDSEYSPKIAGIANLSIDLFIEVAKYLRPVDLLSLARCKLFRSYLMRPSSRFIWLESMKIFAGLPPSPPGFTEPQYLTVLFSNFCTVCGSTEKLQVDATLLVRLCIRCQEQCLVLLIDIDEVPVDIRDFVPRSNVFGKGKRGQLPDARVLKSDVANVLKLLDEAERSGDDSVLSEVRKTMREVVLDRKAQAEAINLILERHESDLRWEGYRVVTERRQEIERKCISDLGCQKEDLQFAWDSSGRNKYQQLMNKSEPLSDREWGEIRPTLKRLLRVNGKARLAKEQEGRHPGQSSYQGELDCPQQPLTLPIDPVIDGFTSINGIEFLRGICG